METECGIHTPPDGILPLDEEKTSDEIETYESHPEVKRRPETVVGVESAGNWRSGYEAVFKFVSGRRNSTERWTHPTEKPAMPIPSCPVSSLWKVRDEW